MFGTIATSGTPDDLKAGGDKINANFAAILALMGGQYSTGGTANAQTLTPSPPISALQDGMRIVARIGSGLTNTAAATLNVSETGNVAVVRNDGATALTGGEMKQNRWVEFQYDAGTASWILLGVHTPTLAIVDRGGTDQTAFADGVWTKVQFTTETIDYNGKFDAATNYRWTPAIPGVVHIAASLHFKSVTAGGLVGVAIYKNGSLYRRAVRDVVASGTDGRGIVQIDAWCTCDNDDYFEIFGMQDSDAAAAKDLAGTVTDTWASFVQLPNL